MTLSPDTMVYLGGGALALIVWLVRLEGKVKSAERENTLLKTAVEGVQHNHNGLALRVVEQLGNIRESLARIEGRIGDGRPLP